MTTNIDTSGTPGPLRAAFLALGRFIFGYRDYLAPAALVAALALTEPWETDAVPWVDTMLDLCGFLVALAGQALRMTVIGYAYIKRGGTDKELDAPRLVVEGFYAHCRNPMYVGNTLLILGLLMIYNSPWVYLVGLPVCLVAFLAITVAEERFLATRFGRAYAEYCARVPRFIPRLRGLRDTMASMRFDWKRVLRKEYGTTFAWLSVALFLLTWEEVVWHGWESGRSTVLAALLAYVPVVAAYVVVRSLKKTKRLHA